MGNKKKTPEQEQMEKTVNDIADNLSKLSASISILLHGKLKRKTLLVLLSHSTKMSQFSVNKVLGALENLDEEFVKK